MVKEKVETTKIRIKQGRYTSLKQKRNKDNLFEPTTRLAWHLIVLGFDFKYKTTNAGECIFVIDARQHEVEQLIHDEMNNEVEFDIL